MESHLDNTPAPGPNGGSNDWNYRLEDLIDMPLFQSLQDKLNEIYSFPAAIIDNEGNVLTATAWQDICTKFHRVHPQCAEECRASDLYILTHLSEARPAVTYRCPHGLVDNATPIVIGGKHLGNYFTGQFFLEEPDLDFFRRHAARYGFDENAYLEAVRKVPVWSEEKLHQYLDFIKGFTEILAGIGYKQLQERQHRRRIAESDSALAEMYAFNRQIIESVEEGIIVYGPDLRYRLWNPYMERLSGVPASEVIGRHPLEVFPFLQEAGVIDRLQEALRGKTCQPIDFSFTTPSGRTLWSSVSTAPLIDKDGRIVGAIATVRDIAERKRIEEDSLRMQAQLTQAQKMESVGRLAGGVAHDFNNMLSVILGHADLALPLLDQRHPLRADLLEIRQAAERSADLTRQLLAFARRQTVSPKVLDLNETVDGMLRMLRRMIGEDIELSWSPCPGPLRICMDPSQVDQIMANLIVNARDAISGVGRIGIATRIAKLEGNREALPAGVQPGKYAVLSVDDNGCGMDRETVEHIFEPFFTTKRTGQGTGLGLATIYGIVNQNSGFIQVFSEPGKGASFGIYLPLYEGSADARVEQGMQRASDPVSGGTGTVLLVEDEPAILDLCKKILELSGFRVLAATSPAEAIRLAGVPKAQIDILVTDVVMPEMNGRELSRQIVLLHPGVRILFMSGYGEEVIAHQGMLEEGVQFMQKPFTVRELVAKVRGALGAGRSGSSA